MVAPEASMDVDNIPDGAQKLKPDVAIGVFAPLKSKDVQEVSTSNGTFTEEMPIDVEPPPKSPYPRPNLPARPFAELMERFIVRQNLPRNEVLPTDSEARRARIQKLMKSPDTRHRFVFQQWPRPPGVPTPWPKDKPDPYAYITPSTSLTGKQVPGSGQQLWGETLLDFYSVLRIPECPNLMTYTTSSKMLAWVKAHPEELDAPGVRACAVSAETENEPQLVKPYDMGLLVKEWEREVRRRYRPSVFDNEKEDHPKEWPPKSIFDPDAYPPPWRKLEPFGTIQSPAPEPSPKPMAEPASNTKPDSVTKPPEVESKLDPAVDPDANAKPSDDVLIGKASRNQAGRYPNVDEDRLGTQATDADSQKQNNDEAHSDAVVVDQKQEQAGSGPMIVDTINPKDDNQVSKQHESEQSVGDYIVVDKNQEKANFLDGQIAKQPDQPDQSVADGKKQDGDLPPVEPIVVDQKKAQGQTTEGVPSTAVDFDVHLKVNSEGDARVDGQLSKQPSDQAGASSPTANEKGRRQADQPKVDSESNRNAGGSKTEQHVPTVPPLPPLTYASLPSLTAYIPISRLPKRLVVHDPWGLLNASGLTYKSGDKEEAGSWSKKVEKVEKSDKERKEKERKEKEEKERKDKEEKERKEKEERERKEREEAEAKEQRMKEESERLDVAMKVDVAAQEPGVDDTCDAKMNTNAKSTSDTEANANANTDANAEANASATVIENTNVNVEATYTKPDTPATVGAKVDSEKADTEMKVDSEVKVDLEAGDTAMRVDEESGSANGNAIASSGGGVGANVDATTKADMKGNTNISNSLDSKGEVGDDASKPIVEVGSNAGLSIEPSTKPEAKLESTTEPKATEPGVSKNSSVKPDVEPDPPKPKYPSYTHIYALRTTTSPDHSRREQDDAEERARVNKAKAVMEAFLKDPRSGPVRTESRCEENVTGKEKSEERELPPGMVLRPRNGEKEEIREGPCRPPIYVVFQPRPSYLDSCSSFDKSAEPEAHLYLSPYHAIGTGNHSYVYSAQWEVPRSLVAPEETEKLCLECVAEDAWRIIDEEDKAEALREKEETVDGEKKGKEVERDLSEAEAKARWGAVKWKDLGGGFAIADMEDWMEEDFEQYGPGGDLASWLNRDDPIEFNGWFEKKKGKKSSKWEESSGRWVVEEVDEPEMLVSLANRAGEDTGKLTSYVVKKGKRERRLVYEGPYRAIMSRVGYQSLERGQYCVHLRGEEGGHGQRMQETSDAMDIDSATGDAGKPCNRKPDDDWTNAEHIHPLTATLRVAAKLSIQHDRHLAVEAQNYQSFPRHFFETWTGYNIVRPVLDPTPVGAIVPQFYGFYEPVEEEGKRKVYKSYLSPILLLEECGKPIKSSTLSADDKNECVAMTYRFHESGWLHGSIFQRNILRQPGPLSVHPSQRTFKISHELKESVAKNGSGTGEAMTDRGIFASTSSFRMIDFGRSKTYPPDEFCAALDQEVMEVRKWFDGFGDLTG